MTESTKTTKTTRGKAPAKKAATGASGAKASTAKAVAPKKPVAAKAKPDAQAAPRAKAKKQPQSIPPEQRRNYVEIAAYYIAERRGFAPGDTVQDWMEAEAEIDRLILTGMLGRPAKD